MTASQQPIAIGGVTVNPGDIVFAEFDGILVVPRADAVDGARARRGDRGRRGPRARRGARAAARRGRASSGMATSRTRRSRRDRGARARRAALGDPRGLRSPRTGCPTRSGSRSASRASARRGSSSTPRSRRPRPGCTGYTPNGGYASLREALAEKIERVDGFAVDPDSVVVTPGAMNALFSIYLALLEPGDEVLLPTPGFPNMDEMVRLLGGEPVFYRLDRAPGLPPLARAARAARHRAGRRRSSPTRRATRPAPSSRPRRCAAWPSSPPSAASG